MQCSSGPVIPEELTHVYQQWHIAPAVRAGNLVICSGVLGQQLDGTIADNPTTQFTLAFENLQRVLAAAGADLTHVVELVTFHTDLEGDLESFSAVKERFIREPYPAWTALGVAQLGAGLTPTPRVEMKATAYLTDTV
ncbi:RidA family protein [Rhodococcus spelaei]|nr:RidA family protein [Rhodococcus spelaei]